MIIKGIKSQINFNVIKLIIVKMIVKIFYKSRKCYSTYFSDVDKNVLQNSVYKYRLFIILRINYEYILEF